jgi:hypothetical protein
MDDGDGMFTMELQARQIAENAARYNGSHPCPDCGVIMDPAQALYSKGMCVKCYANKMSKRIKGRMV